MRGVETRIQGIRHSIFTEIARMAYETDGYVGKRIEELPYEIIPGKSEIFAMMFFWSVPLWERDFVWPWVCPAEVRQSMRLCPIISNWQISRRRIIRRL